MKNRILGALIILGSSVAVAGTKDSGGDTRADNFVDKAVHIAKVLVQNPKNLKFNFDVQEFQALAQLYYKSIADEEIPDLVEMVTEKPRDKFNVEKVAVTDIDSKLIKVHSPSYKDYDEKERYILVTMELFVSLKLANRYESARKLINEIFDTLIDLDNSSKSASTTWIIDDSSQLKALVPDAETLFNTIDRSNHKYKEAVISDAAKNLNFGGLPIYAVPVYSSRRRSIQEEIDAGNLMAFPGVCASVARPNEYHSRMLVLGKTGKNLAALIISILYNVNGEGSSGPNYSYTLDPTQPNIVSQNSRIYSDYSRLDPDSETANFLPSPSLLKYGNADKFLKPIEKGLTFWKKMPDQDELFGAISTLSGFTDEQRQNVISHLKEFNEQMYLTYGYQFASDEDGSHWNLNFRVGRKSTYTSTGTILNKVDSSHEEDELRKYMSDKRNITVDQYSRIITASRFLRESCYFFTVNNLHKDSLALGMASPAESSMSNSNGTYDLVDHLKYLTSPIEDRPHKENYDSDSHYGSNGISDNNTSRTNSQSTGPTFQMNGGIYIDASKNYQIFQLGTNYIIEQNGLLNGMSIDSNKQRGNLRWRR